MLSNRMVSFLIMYVGMMLLFVGCGTGSEHESDGNHEPVIPSHVDYKKEDADQIVESQNELGFKLLPIIETDDDDNMFISPTSLFMALSMVYNGADGLTKEEIAKTLESEDIEIEALNRANAALLTNLHDKSKTELSIGNSIWLNDDFSLDKTFQQNTSDYFHAEVKEIDVRNTGAAEEINNWVEEATNEKITDMVEPPLSQNLVAMLINAIYFKGDWVYEFDSKQTENHDFKTEKGDTKQVPLMTLEEELNYMENELFQAVELPYTDNEMSMHVFLPKDARHLSEFTDLLTTEKWKKWQDEFTKTEGTLMMPKFELEYEVLLNDPLIELGMGSAFDAEKADFPNLTEGEEDLFISEVKQKTYVKVNEEGTEAAAATSVAIVMSSANLDTFHMTVDRPFFFTITENETGAILFMGSVSSPPVAKK